MVERGKESILVVDDEAIVLSLVSNTLTKHGYTPILAVDGEHGLHCFTARRNEIDLVLTDMSMPKLSGPQMAGKIRQIDPAINLMFMTGYSLDSEIPAEFASCATLQKPFTCQRLIAAIRK